MQSTTPLPLEPALPRLGGIADLVALTKPRLSSLVLVTAAGGIWLAPGHLVAARLWLTLFAIAGTVGAANALNCFIERDRDRKMARTRNRPLPSGRLEPSAALGFGILLGAFSLPMLALVANPLTGLLGLVAFASYVFVYTPLKPRSAAAMWVGALPGALPPLMGWTAVTGHLGATGLVLFAILFLWQLPHFLAIALFRKDEYAAAGLASVPLSFGDRHARIELFIEAVLLLPVTLCLYPLHLAGPLYAICAVGLGAWFVKLAWPGLTADPGKRWARGVFFYSLVYLAGLFLALVLDVLIRR